MDPKHLASLRVHDACQGLSADEIEAITANVDVVEVNAGETFHTAGQEIDALYIVVKGRLRMALDLPDGRQRTIRYISAGDQFGALMLVTDDEFPVDVVVDETATLLRIEEKLAEQLVQQFPRFRRNLMRKIGFDVRDSILGARRERSISKVVAFTQVDNETRKLVTEIASRLSLIGEKIGILTDSQDDSADQAGIRFKSIRGQDGRLLGPSEVRQAVSQW